MVSLFYKPYSPEYSNMDQERRFKFDLKNICIYGSGEVLQTRLWYTRKKCSNRLLKFVNLCANHFAEFPPLQTNAPIPDHRHHQNIRIWIKRGTPDMPLINQKEVQQTPFKICEFTWKPFCEISSFENYPRSSSECSHMDQERHFKFDHQKEVKQTTYKICEFMWKPFCGFTFANPCSYPRSLKLPKKKVQETNSKICEFTSTPFCEISAFEN